MAWRRMGAASFAVSAALAAIVATGAAQAQGDVGLDGPDHLLVFQHRVVVPVGNDGGSHDHRHQAAEALASAASASAPVPAHVSLKSTRCAPCFTSIS